MKVLLAFVFLFVFARSEGHLLHEAVRSSNKEEVKRLLESGEDINNQDNEWGFTPLMLADEEMAFFLLEQGADPHLLDLRKSSALHYAIHLKKNALAEELVKRGVDVKQVDEGGACPLDLALVKRNQALALTLIKQGASPSGNMLEAVAFCNSVDIVELLLRQGFQPNDFLHFAAKHNALEMLKFLLEKGADPDRLDESGYTPLMLAQSEAGHLLLEYGADPFIKNRQNATALHCALYQRHFPLVLTLIERGVSVNQGDNVFGAAPIYFIREDPSLLEDCASPQQLLYLYAAIGDLEKLKSVVQEGIQLDSKALSIAMKNRQLHVLQLMTQENISFEIENLHAALGMPSLKVLKLLIEKGGDVNELNQKGQTPLMFANAAEAFFLLKKGADPHLVDAMGRSALHYALRQKDPRLATFLIEKGVNVHQVDCEGDTPLILAARYGERPYFLFFHLLKRGANPHVLNHQKRSALHEALNSNSNEIAEHLIEMGVEIHQEDSNGKTPIEIALEKNNREMAELLFEKGALLSKQSFQDAVSIGAVEIVKYLVQQGVDVNQCDSSGCPPLIQAMEWNQEEEMAHVLLEAGANPHLLSQRGDSTLVRALSNHREALAFELIDRGVDVHQVDQWGYRPLDLALLLSKELAMTLIKKGACPSKEHLKFAVRLDEVEVVQLLVEQGFHVHDFLHFAAEENVLKVLAFLLQKGADPNLLNHEGQTPLMVASVEAGQLLLEKGADPHFVSDTGATALHEALRHRCDPLALELIARGADVHQEDNNGQTPLGVALATWNRELVQALLEKGARPSIHSLHDAVESGAIDIVKALVAQGVDVNQDGLLLHALPWESSIEIVPFLLEQGADINQVDSSGRTPLMIAIRDCPHESMADRLLKRGANPHAVDCDGMSALTYAVLGIRTALALQLFNQGCDVEYVTEEGWDMLHLALSYHHRELAKALMKKGMLPSENHLHAALSADSVEVIQLLLEKGLHPNDVLHDAARYNACVVLASLLNHGADPNHLDKHGQTPLMIAWGEAGHVLLEKGADPHLVNDGGESALGYALSAGQKTLVLELIDRGVSVNHEVECFNPINIALLDGNLEVAMALFEKGAQPSDRFIKEAAALGARKIVESMLERGVKPSRSALKLIQDL